MASDILDTVLIFSLPASGKSETRTYMSSLTPEQCRRDMAMGPTLQLDDYPYVHFMHRIDDELLATHGLVGGGVHREDAHLLYALGGLLVPADRFYGRVDEVLARIEAGAGRDAQDLLDLRDRCLELFKVTSRGGVPEVWLLGQKLLGAASPT